MSSKNVKRNRSIDLISWILLFVSIYQCAVGIYESGSLNEAKRLMFLNPLLGGDAGANFAKGVQLPTWTYAVGHVIPGIVLQFLGAFIAIVLTQEWNYVGGDMREDVRCIVVTLFTMMGSAVFLAPVHKMVYEKQFGHMFFDIDEQSLLTTFFGLIVAIAITETWFYWIHRLSHTDFIYRYIHSVHHSFVPSTATCAAAFHPLDVVLLTTGSFVAVAIWPVHHSVHQFVLMLNLASTIYQHTGVRGTFGQSLGIFSNPNLHNIHHDYGMTPRNCGSLTCIWDRICGTYEPNIPPFSEAAKQSNGIKKN